MSHSISLTQDYRYRSPIFTGYDALTQGIGVPNPSYTIAVSKGVGYNQPI